MFDIGFGELLLIGVVALVVLGPERLPKAARFAGLWVRRARNQWDSVKQELERELHAEELKRNLSDVRQSMQQAEQEMREGAQQVQQRADALRHDVERGDVERVGAAAVDEAAALEAPVETQAVEDTQPQANAPVPQERAP